jgi:uncharacterized protein
MNRVEESLSSPGSFERTLTAPLWQLWRAAKYNRTGMKALNEVNLKPRDRAAIGRAAQILHSQFAARQVVLFGPRARGDDDPESDIDLLVLLDGKVDQPLKSTIRRVLYTLGLELGVCFSTLMIPINAWEEGVYRVMPIRGEIERDGVAA